MRLHGEIPFHGNNESVMRGIALLDGVRGGTVTKTRKAESWLLFVPPAAKNFKLKTVLDKIFLSGE
jgi:hypothetical protein